MIRKATRLAMICIAVLALAAVAACSSSGGSSGTSTTAAATGTAKTPAQSLEAAYKGVTGTPPTTPTKPKAGVNLWVVSCGEQVPSCATPVAAVEEAGKLVGWTVNKCDGQLNPGGWGTCIRQATSAKADAIIPIGIDCPSVQAPMQEAKAAGVKLIGGGAADCSAVGGPKIMDSERLQLDNYSIEQYWNLNGRLQAQWIVGKTNGQAKVVLAKFTDPIWGPWLADGFTKELATCSGCSVVSTLELANNDFVSNTAASKFSTALLQAPSANAVSVPVGGWMLQGFSQAVMSSGRFSQLSVASGFGDSANMDLIRQGQGQGAAVGYASQWGAYGSVDTAIRIINGEQALVQGDGMQMVDKDNNMPATGDYTGNVDFKAAYKKAWGVS
ncbi:MAG: sugar ABC transporter substrate-binding protein [Dermatophilaceae bacterium]